MNRIIKELYQVGSYDITNPVLFDLWLFLKKLLSRFQVALVVSDVNLYHWEFLQDLKIVRVELNSPFIALRSLFPVLKVLLDNTIEMPNDLTLEIKLDTLFDQGKTLFILSKENLEKRFHAECFGVFWLLIKDFHTVLQTLFVVFLFVVLC